MVNLPFWGQGATSPLWVQGEALQFINEYAKMRILTLSAGVWGTTLSVLLAENGHDVTVWEYSGKVVEEIRRTGHHPRLPHMPIPSQIAFSTDLAQALAGREVVLCVVPAEHVRSTLSQLAQQGYAGQIVIMASKGIEQGSMALLADVAREVLGPSAEGRIGLLSGPTIAWEVSQGVPTAITASAADPAVARTIQGLFHSPRFRVYTQTDMVGVELASALKNVIAIACGINDGLGLGANSKAALITRGLWEITRLGTRLGARAETFYGLAGIGDLVVTCTSTHSRNRTFGELLGKGMPPAQALEQVGMVVEGYYTVRAALDLARKAQVELPIIQAVYDVVFGNMSPQAAVMALMQREAKPEGEQ